MPQQQTLNIIQTEQLIKEMLRHHQLKETAVKVCLEDGMIQCIAPLQTLADADLFQALILIKQQLPNIRIDHIADHFLVVRDLGKNAYQPLAPLEGLRIRFRRTRKGAELELQKKGFCKEKELYLLIQLLKFFFGKSKAIDSTNTVGIQSLANELEELGIQVSLPSTPKPAQPLPNRTGQKQNRMPLSNSEGIPDLPGFVGYPETRKALYQNVIIPLAHPEIFEQIKNLTRKHSSSRLAVPRAILFEGPPGVGKTTVARNLANHSQTPLLSIPIERILSKFYGESEVKLRHIFDLADRFPKVIVFFDELDALGTSREEKIYEATRRLLSVLLTRLDGFQKTEGILTVGATNRRRDLDPALLSRFDTIIPFHLPDAKSRHKILSYYSRHLRKSELDILAETASLLSGRDLENLCVQAEREWAHHLMQNNSTINIAPPPVQVYLELIKKLKQIRGSRALK